MAKVYGLWHGGANYSPGYVDQDVEEFSTITAAKNALRERARYGGWDTQIFNYVNRPQSVDLTPCADQGATMTIWYADPTGNPDPYPDRLLTLTERGAVRVEYV